MVLKVRPAFKSFWDQYSGTPDTNTMMLNHSADDLESSDRADILACLPQLKNKDVVDIGAGIGRFTTVLAESAKSVLSTDFIESFIAKNQERNAHLGNINYQVGDAVNLKMDSGSVDLVFTNWLMMYLSDSEVVEFIFSTMRWLRADGMIHLRESCSEPSTGRSKTSTMHKDTNENPTHYRFSSLYIRLFQNIRYRDENGKVWRLELKWSCSVPTYIKRQNNWRQVHWLMQKVPSETNVETQFNDLVEMFSNTWQKEQLEWDAMLDGEKYVWTDKIFSNVLNADTIAKNGTIFVYTPRTESPYLHVNSHLLSEKYTCNVWNVELVPWYYRTSLTKANTVKDQRVRFGWNKDLSSSIEYWVLREGCFDSVVATELLATCTEQELEELQLILKPEAGLVTLEAMDEINEEKIKQKLTNAGFKNITIEDVTDRAQAAIEEFEKDHQKDLPRSDKRWVVVEAKL